MNDRNLTVDTVDEDYKQLEYGLELAQKELKEALFNLNSDSTPVECLEKTRMVTNVLNNESNEESLDFKSIFEQNGLLDVMIKDSSAHAAVNTFPYGSATYPLVPHRPHRPMTLSRPGQLPSCCNFKRQHWRLYVQGEFSYSSLPRYFKDAEKELNSSYKDDLENIIRDLNKKEKILELEQFTQTSRNSESTVFRGNVSSHVITSETHLQQALDPVKNCAKQALVHVRTKGGHDFRSIVNSSNGCDNVCSQFQNSPGKSFDIKHNNCLMEDINKNCDNIHSQLAILESMSQVIGPVETKAIQSENGVQVSLCSLHLPEEDNLGQSTRPATASPQNSLPLFFKNTDKTLPVLVPLPPPPEELLTTSDVSSCPYSSTNKKLKSRKSRNRSLQRSNEERLSASERRSRTLSPAVTERLDYKVSRATQTGNNSNISQSVPHSCQADKQKGAQNKSSSDMEGVANGKTVNLGTSSEKKSKCKQQPDVSTDQKLTGREKPLTNLTLSSNSTGDSTSKQQSEDSKFSPLCSQKRKISLKRAVSFAAYAKSVVKGKSLSLEQASSTDHQQCNAIACCDSLEKEPICKPSETLLDKMHKKLYPYQYNKQNRIRSPDVLNLSAKRSSGLPKLHLFKDTNLDCSRQAEHLKVRYSNKLTSNELLIKTCLTKDECTVEVASPSSGYSEMSPLSLKENATSPDSVRLLNFARALSREQSTTSSSTPSPSSGPVSVAKATDSFCSREEDQLSCIAKNSKDICQLQVAEKKLTEVCEWLIYSGFPQYVQLYREGHFPVALTTVESDHEFLDKDCLLILLQQITLLNKLMTMKTRLPLTSSTRDWYSGEMVFAVSPIWHYDQGYHWWLRSDRTFITNWAKSDSLLRSHSRNNEVRTENLEVEGGFSTPLEVPDEASVHLTSGYESETSPISSSSLGQQKILPLATLCSSSQLTYKSNTPILTSQSSKPGILTQNIPEGNRDDGDVFLDSSQETLKRVSSGSHTSSVYNQQVTVENVSVENIPKQCAVNASVGSDGTNSDLIKDNQVLKASQKNSNGTAVLCLELGQPVTENSCNSSKVSDTADFRNRKSFYDNTLPSNPQMELDIILKELYRNIGCLDETLNNLDESDNGNLVNDRLLPSEDPEYSNDVFVNSENLNENGMEISITSMQDQDSPGFTEVSQNYRLKKAFLTVEDLVRLRKLCILKLTSVFETHCSSSRLICPLRYQSSELTRLESEEPDRRIFGVSLVVILQKIGIPLPPTITLAMKHLKSAACDSVGLFRKPGVQSRIQLLQNEMENNAGFHDFDAVDAYDLADVLKRYFRELPESLLTPQASVLLMKIFTDVPADLHLEMVQAVMLLLSDINRQVLHILLQFLAAVADHSTENQMNASNLAVCFLPSFFRPHYFSSPGKQAIDTKSNSNCQTLDVSDSNASPAWDHKVAVTCISFLIDNTNSIFQIPEFSWIMLHASVSTPETSFMLGIVADFRSVDISSFVQQACELCNLKDSEWISHASKYDETEVSWWPVEDSHLLPLWRCRTAIEAPPCEVLVRLKGEQHLWDCSLVKGRIAERVNDKTDVYCHVLHIDSHEAPREFCELRTWKCDRERGSYILAKTSVFHPNVPLTETLRAITFVSHYLIEPCGAGKSRVTHVSRVDIRGHLLDWYHNVYGRMAEKHLHKLHNACTPFTANAAGPETNL